MKSWTTNHKHYTSLTMLGTQYGPSCIFVLDSTIDLVTFLMVILMLMKVAHPVFWGNKDIHFEIFTWLPTLISNCQTLAKLTPWAWGA